MSSRRMFLLGSSSNEGLVPVERDYPMSADIRKVTWNGHTGWFRCCLLGMSISLANLIVFLFRVESALLEAVGILIAEQEPTQHYAGAYEAAPRPAG